MKKISVSQTTSRGYAVGKAFLVKREEICIDRTSIEDAKKTEEITRYVSAVEHTKQQLVKLGEDSEIFSAYMQLVEDPMLLESVKQKIEAGSRAEAAVEDTINEYIAIFENLEDVYMRERAADLKDVKKRLLYALNGVDENPFAELKAPAIIIAEELTPSDTADMDMGLALGFLSEVGGATSHVSIIAKAHGIPCLTGVKDICLEAIDGMIIAMDAENGEVYIEPESDVLDEFYEKKALFDEREKKLEAESSKPSVTVDGHRFMVCANVGNVQEVKDALSSQLEGVGLFRSEFIYMQKKNDFPTEEEQFEIYKEAAALMEGKEIIIRTLDIGGDKSLEYYQFEKEDNPFLGCRAIRLCLRKKEVFKTQLRALLRAGVYGNIKIMYPMMVSVEELEEANVLLEECKKELETEGIAYRKDIEVGMMIETPASVLMADDFAQRVDFFSIGTNDLTQYVLAVDRGNEAIRQLYNFFHPAVLRAINHIIERAHAHGIKAGMCGELASDEKAARLLLGMGLDEFSMAAGSIKNVKYRLRECEFEQTKELVGEVLKQSTVKDVMALLEK